MVTDRRLAGIALETHWVTLAWLKKVVPACLANHKPLAVAFRALGLTDEQITFMQACALQLPFARPDRLRISPRVQSAIPIDLQQRYRVAPLRSNPGMNGETLYAAMLPEVAAELANRLSIKLGVTVIPVAASAQAIGIAIARNVSGITDPGEDFASPQDLDLDTPASPSEYSFTTSGGEVATGHSQRDDAKSAITTLADF